LLDLRWPHHHLSCDECVAVAQRTTTRITEAVTAPRPNESRRQQLVFLQKSHDLTSNPTAHIAYGGSYAGAFVSFLRVLYPGVTRAIYDYWQYCDAVAKYGSKKCIAAQKTFTHMVDNILIG
jgi:hypothetical protein